MAWQWHKVTVEMARHDGKPTDHDAEVNVFGQPDADAAGQRAMEHLSGTKNADPVRVVSVKLKRKGAVTDRPGGRL